MLITAIVRAKAAADIFRPASAIIEEVLLDQMTDGPCSSLPQPDYVAEAASRKHQQLRLKDPLDLDFKLEESPDGFFHLELKVHGRPSILFSLGTGIGSTECLQPGLRYIPIHKKDAGTALPGKERYRANV